MSGYKRYTVILDAYLHARNDREAMVEAARLAEYLQKADDNQAQVMELEETPINSYNHRLIHKGRLTLFENKLIEA
jgi:hypothetical protein